MSGSRELGKKCETRFTLVESFLGFAIVNAATTFDRVHQVRVHAAESGLKVVGGRSESVHPLLFAFAAIFLARYAFLP